MTRYNQEDELPEMDSFEAQIAELAAQSPKKNKESGRNPFLDPPINPHPRSDLE
ncbi:hypothetical protein [Cohnella panacarvi]|uniref:hypothetical protein n=1 Tax=Cohnella panacarvi TaxID=400776 RepID=UPI0004BB274B|nr:hypothetical protein [Cohnella panacarvi]